MNQTTLLTCDVSKSKIRVEAPPGLTQQIKPLNIVYSKIRRHFRLISQHFKVKRTGICNHRGQHGARRMLMTGQATLCTYSGTERKKQGLLGL